MSTRIEPRDEYSETLVVIHDCGHERRVIFAAGRAAQRREHYDTPECSRCASRRQQQEEGKA